MAKATLISRESIRESSETKLRNKAVKDCVRLASQSGNMAGFTDAIAEDIKVRTTIHGVLTQSGEYKGKRFRGAKDHSPEANLAVLVNNTTGESLPDITD